LEAGHYWATSRGFVSDEGELADTDGCDIPLGVRFSILVDAPTTTRTRRKRVEPTTTETPVAVEPEPHKDAIVAQVQDDAPTTVATTEVEPPAPAFDPMAVAQANPMLAFALAALAVVGGGAGWRFWTKMSEQKHEQKMKELELQAQAQGLGGAQPPPCQVKQAEVDAKLAALEARVAKAERTSLALGDDFDPEDIQKRIVLLERSMKRMGVKPTAGGSK
jgi:uncharacterized protein HemX